MSPNLETLARNRKGKPSPIRGKRFPIELLTDQEILSLIKACSPKCPSGVRNRAILALMYRGCLRVSEVTALAVRDLDASQGTLCVRHGKGNKRRVIGLDPQTVALVQVWLGARQKLGLGNQLPLFCTLKGRDLKPVYLRNLCRRLARKVGISKRTHPHLLRHCGAVSLIREGLNVPEVSQALGHSSIATTSVYLAHVCPQELVNKMTGRTWDI